MLTFFVGGGGDSHCISTFEELGTASRPSLWPMQVILDHNGFKKTKQQQKRFPWVEAPSVKCIHISSVAACSPGLKREDAVVRFFPLDFLGPYLPIQWSIFSYEFAQ